MTGTHRRLDLKRSRTANSAAIRWQKREVNDVNFNAPVANAQAGTSSARADGSHDADGVEL